MFLSKSYPQNAFCFWVTHGKPWLFESTHRRGFVWKSTHTAGEKAWLPTCEIKPLKKDDDDEPATVLEAILGQVGQREDTACDEDGVDVSVGVDVDAVVGVGVHGQGVNLGVGLGVGLVVGPPLTSLNS